MAEQIKFSVVVPAYNVEKDLPALLQNLLEQTYKTFEVIVVDDCATDETGKGFVSAGIPWKTGGLCGDS